MHAASAESEPVPQHLREQLLDPFIAAACGTLREWTGTEAAVRATFVRSRPPETGDHWAALELTFANERGMLVLAAAAATATALAHRILAEAAPDVNDTLVRDCLGELANVTAGQAKALLHGTPLWFRLATPKVAPVDVDWPAGSWLVAVLSIDLGDLALQLCVPSAAPPAG